MTTLITAAKEISAQSVLLQNYIELKRSKNLKKRLFARARKKATLKLQSGNTRKKSQIRKI